MMARACVVATIRPTLTTGSITTTLGRSDNAIPKAEQP